MALLHRPYLLYSPEKSHASNRRHSLARDTMDRVSWEFFRESEKIVSGDGPSLHTMSPLVLHWGYETLVHFILLARTEPKEQTHAAMRTVQSALQKVNWRWRAAGMRKYILHSFPNIPHSEMLIMLYRCVPGHFERPLSISLICVKSCSTDR